MLNMDPLKCSLEWSPNFSKKFQAHLAKTEFSDVTLVSSDGKEFPGHGIILAAGAAFFESVLRKENNSSQRLGLSIMPFYPSFRCSVFF